MKGTGRGKGGRGSGGSGRGNLRGRGNCRMTSQPEIQPIQGTAASLESEQPSNPSQGPLQIEQISSSSIPRISPGTQSSRNLEESVHLSPDGETGAVSCVKRKRGRGIYKSKTVEYKTKLGGKITIVIPEDIDRAVGNGARDIVNYSGLIMRTSVSFRDGNWQNIVLKHEEEMWLKVKDKFEVSVGLRELRFQGFVISTMQILFRAWKARLHIYYASYSTDAERLSHPPENVQLEDWKYLIKYFGSDKFKDISERNKKNRQKQITKHSCGTKSFAEVEEATRNPESGEKEASDKVWERHHTRKNVNGELLWSDPQSKQIHVQLQQVVVEQQSEEVEHPMTRDEILASVLGERSGYVRGKEYGKKPPKKTQIKQADVEASVSSAVESMRHEMEEDLRKKMKEDLQKKFDDELQKKLEEEREHMKAEVDKIVQQQLAAIMTTVLQGQGS